MLKKVIYLTIVALILSVKNAFCDPVSATIATVEAVGAFLGPAGVIAGVGLGIEGISLANAASQKLPNAPNAPAAPNQDTAAQTALDNQTEARRTLLASGGETTLTGVGGAPLLGGNTQSKTLLGGG